MKNKAINTYKKWFILFLFFGFQIHAQVIGTNSPYILEGPTTNLAEISSYIVHNGSGFIESDDSVTWSVKGGVILNSGATMSNGISNITMGSFQRTITTIEVQWLGDQQQHYIEAAIGDYYGDSWFIHVDLTMDFSGFTLNSSNTSIASDGTYDIIGPIENLTQISKYDISGSISDLDVEWSVKGGVILNRLATISNGISHLYNTSSIEVRWIDNEEDHYVDAFLIDSWGYDYWILHADLTMDSAPPSTITPTVLSNENYVYTRTYQKAMTSDAGITKNSDITESITYFDGLGKPLQQIAIGQSPNFKDIIATSNYDAFGRVEKEFLPFESSNGALGSYRTEDLVLATKTFYKNKYPDDFEGITDVNEINPFTQKEFEPSPLNRVIKMAAPGKDWKLGSGHEVKLDYLLNEANEVKIYSVLLDAERTPTLSGGTAYYAAGQLFKSVIKDENWKVSDGNNFTTVEFKDKQGMVLLKRTYNANIPHDTYYVYDNYGNLTYTFPPKAEAQTAIPDAVKLSELCYQYKYDSWNRLVEKKLPAKQKEYIIYDGNDRPILTQDGSLRSNNLWAFSKFDAYGRNIYGGLYSNSNERKVIQQEVDAYILSTNKNNNEERVSSTVLIGQVNLNYNNVAFPTTGITEVLTVNYYDDYTFIDTDKPTIPTTVLGDAVTQRTNGLQTASWVKTLGQSTWAKNYIVYDEKGREIKIIAKNYLGGSSIVESKLDFSGKVEKTVTSHKKLTTDTPIIITDNFEYDHTGRLLRNTQQINSQPIEVIASNTYDNLGMHIQKNVGGTAIKPLQKIDYAYNIKGALTQINNVNSALSTSNDNDLFAYKINYNNAIEGTASASKLYNGNITQTIWRTINADEKQSYSYNYDHLNRISNGLYSAGSALNNDTDKFKLSGVTYDLNGNIKTLARTGETGQIDNLIYNYTNAGGAATNQLVDVTDAANNAEGYNDAVVGGSNYVYDSNGRLISDANKGITNIEYNYLDLAKKVIFTNGSTVEILYDAAGNKLEKLYVTANGTTKTLYIDGFQYQNDQLQFFGQTEGYAYNDNGTFRNAYIYADHLGNNRLSYSDTNGNGTISTDEIFSQSNYYPFGLTHRGELIGSIGSTYNYKFQGKEQQLENGLQQYDFGSRMYDASIGRWMVLDPQAEQTFGFSPYMAMGNNPVIFTDSNGELFGLDDAILGLVTGIVNTVGNAKSIDNLGDGLSYFAIGFVAGFSATWTGGTGTAFILSVGNSTYTQYSKTGSVDGSVVANDVSIGMLTAGIGASLGSTIQPLAGKLFSGIANETVQQYVTNGASYAITGFSVSTAGSLAQGKSVGDAFNDGYSSILPSLLLSAVNTKASNIIQNRNNISQRAKESVDLSSKLMEDNNAAKTGTFGKNLFLSEKFGITSERFGSSFVKAQGSLNQPGGLFKMGWSNVAKNGGGMQMRFGIGSKVSNPNQALFHMYVPKTFVPNSFANPSMQVKLSLYKLGLKL